jgi:hypothetical protein
LTGNGIFAIKTLVIQHNKGSLTNNLVESVWQTLPEIAPRFGWDAKMKPASGQKYKGKGNWAARANE